MSPPAQHLVDELLEEIFLCLPTPAALARASTSSPRFRRIITDRSFLRRYHKLHPPPLLGYADENGFHPAQEPHPSAPLAHAFADVADFTYSFVPKPREGHWSPCDARDGRVLLEASPPWEAPRVLAVCDPLSRRYVLIPSIPEDLAAQEEKLVEMQSMLAPLWEDEDETSFRIICPAHYESKLVAYVFSSVTGNWCVAASLAWTSLGTDERPEHALAYCNYLRGCFYWTELWLDKLLVLDTRSMEFSAIDFLTGYHNQIVDQPGQNLRGSYVVAGRGGEEALEMVSLVAYHSTEGSSVAVHHTVQQINDESSMEWQLKKVIPLPGPCSNCFASGAAEEFLFLGANRYVEVEPNIDNNWLRTCLEDYYLSLKVQTSETMEVCSRKFKYRSMGTLFDCEFVYWYFGFPPSLSIPSV